MKIEKVIELVSNDIVCPKCKLLTPAKEFMFLYVCSCGMYHYIGPSGLANTKWLRKQSSLVCLECFVSRFANSSSARQTSSVRSEEIAKLRGYRESIYG